MKNFIICLATFFGFVFNHQGLLAECDEKYNMENLSQDNEFPVSLDNIYFDNDTILVNVEGVPYSIHGLRKFGNQWLANGEQVYYCRNLHSLCKQCHQCHTRECRYYVRLCKQWENK